MANQLIFIADDGHPITLTYSKNPSLDGVRFGVWLVETSELLLSTQAWEEFNYKKKDLRSLKPLMDKLYKQESIKLSNPS